MHAELYYELGVAFRLLFIAFFEAAFEISPFRLELLLVGWSTPLEHFPASLKVLCTKTFNLHKVISLCVVKEQGKKVYNLCHDLSEHKNLNRMEVI